MKRTTTVIIGAGQSGLSFSRHLAALAIDHVVLERGEIANSWRRERWDSLRLLTPNWLCRLPGQAYDGSDPNGYMTADDVADFLGEYAVGSAAPVETHTAVLSVSTYGDGYRVETTSGDWCCQSVVIASGACNIANIPHIADGLPANIQSRTTLQYKKPGDLCDSGVLIAGASASGAQLAREIQASGRQVTLSVGEHVRLPRRYRGQDICWWMDRIGLMDDFYTEVDDLARARKVASLQLMGSRERANIDLNSLRDAGVRIAGRLQGLHDGTALFSGALNNHCALADLKMNRLLDSIDLWVSETGQEGMFELSHRFAETRIDATTPLSLDLKAAGIGTVIWATGYRPDYSWLNLPVFDRKGGIRHDGGIAADVSGVYVMGLPFMRRRKSSYIDGAGADAADLSRHLAASLHRKAA